jgi:hypothetical protein
MQRRTTTITATRMTRPRIPLNANARKPLCKTKNTNGKRISARHIAFATNARQKFPSQYATVTTSASTKLTSRKTARNTLAPASHLSRTGGFCLSSKPELSLPFMALFSLACMLNLLRTPTPLAHIVCCLVGCCQLAFALRGNGEDRARRTGSLTIEPQVAGVGFSTLESISPRAVGPRLLRYYQSDSQ